MRITKVRCQLLTASTSLSALGATLANWTTALTIIETDTGLTGIGECYAGLFAPDAVAALVEQFSPLLVGEDPRRVTYLHDKLYAKSLFWAKAGLPLAVAGTIENALWDLKGQALGVPVYELLGGRAHDRIKVYASGGLEDDIEATVDEMKGYVAQGYKAVKIRIWNDYDSDVRKLRAAREALGDDVEMMVDAVMGHNPRPWSAKEALRRAAVLEELNVRWYEEPCGNRDYAGYAFVRDHTSVPVAGGESAVGLHEFTPFFDAGSLDIAQPDPAHSGGIIEVQRIAAMARAKGVQVLYHSWGAAPCLLANYHMAFADPFCEYLEFPTHALPFIDALAIQPFTLVDGCFEAPTARGLGVQLPDELVEEYPYQPGTGFWT